MSYYVYGPEPPLSPRDTCGCDSGLPADRWIAKGLKRIPCCKECKKKWDDHWADEVFDSYPETWGW